MLSTLFTAISACLRVLLLSGMIWSFILGSAQAQTVTYDQIMRQGYEALLAQDHRAALQFFTEAEQLQPDDPYAVTAIQNIEAFLNQAPVPTARTEPLLSPSLPLNLGAPGNRTSAGIRSRCSALASRTEQKLTALAPRLTRGATLSSHPTFLFYIPETVAQQVEFALSDPQQQVIYRQILPLTQTPGIITVRVPAEVAPLQSGQVYRWGLELVCDLEDPAKNATVIGNVQRVDLPAVISPQASLAPQKQLTLQHIQGIWFDVIATLADLRHSDPEDPGLMAAWTAVLAAEDLETLAQEPLLSCCQP